MPQQEPQFIPDQEPVFIPDEVTPKKGSFVDTLKSWSKRGLAFAEDQGPMIAGAAIGGTIGSALGPIGTLGGGAIGGSAGESLRQIIMDLAGNGPATSSEAASAISTAGLGGALQEAGGAFLPKAGTGIARALEKSATRDYEKVLGATTKASKAKAREVIPGLLQRRIIAASREGLETNLIDKSADAAAPMAAKEAAVIAAEKAGLARPDIDALGLIDTLSKFRNRAVIPGSGGIVADPALANAIDTQIDTLNQLVIKQGVNISKESAIGLRKILDRVVVRSNEAAYHGGDASLGASAEAEKAAANALRREIAAKEPDLAKFYAEFSFWKTAQDVIKATNLRKVSQSGIVGKVLGSGSLGAAAGAAEYYRTGQAQESTGVALAVALLGQAMQGTAWKTVAAVTKHEIADALASGHGQIAIQAIGRIGGKASSLGIANTQSSDQ